MAYLAGVLALAAIVGLLFYLRRYNAERIEVARIRTAFSRYVSPQIVDELLIAIRFCSTQFVIEMNDRNDDPELPAQLEQKS